MPFSRNDALSRLAGLAVLWLALISGVVAVAGARPQEPAARPELLEIPEPATAQLESDIQEQLADERAKLETVLAGNEDPVELAEAFGRLGQHYYLYDLTSAAAACFSNAAALQSDDPRWHYYLGAIGQLDGDLEQAADRLARVLELAPEDLATLIRFGNVSVDLGLPDEAEGSYKRALAAEAGNAAALYGLGRVAVLRKDWQAAIPFLEQALAAQPEATLIHHQLGMSHRALGELDAARDHLSRNTGVRVQFSDPLVQNLSRLIRSSQVYFKAGVDAMRQGRMADAVAQFRKAVEEDPDDALNYYNLALAELESGDRTSAIADLQRSIEVDPEFRNGHFNLATLMAEEGRLVEAERHFRRAHEIDVEDLVAHLEWVAILSRLERDREARAEIGRLLERDPENARAHLSLAILDARSERAVEARAGFERVLASSRASEADRAEAHHQLAVMSERSRDFAAAEGHYRQAAGFEPESPNRHEVLARAKGRIGDFAGAVASYDRVIALVPQRASAHFGRAMALLLGERFAEARMRMEESLIERPTDVELAHLLARLMATAPEERVRDGERARTLALQIFEAAPTLERAETVAMAMAELGRWPEAIDWQGKVITQLERAGDGASLPVALKRLELYRTEKPCRSPWLGPGG